MLPLPVLKYDIIYIDPPWPYYGSTTKNAAAGKHYDLMSMDDIKALPIRESLNKTGACFCWTTGPKLHFGIQALEAWGLHYRGIAHIWAKCRKSDGQLIHGQGVPATYSKPTSELLLLATTCKKGRPFPLLDHKLPQIVAAPRGEHSAKPQVFRDLIVKGYGDRSRLEMFARGTRQSLPLHS